MKWLTIENEFGILQKMNIKRRKMMYTESKNGTKKLTTYQLTLTAVMAAVICVLGPISIAIPVSPVPISLASMAVYLAVTVLGMKLGTLSCLIYLLLGLVGQAVRTDRRLPDRLPVLGADCGSFRGPFRRK